jgi:hypothetical protein
MFDVIMIFYVCVILGFGREAADNCALLGQYAPSSDNFSPTFRDNTSVQSSRFKNPKKKKRERESLHPQYRVT